MTENATGRAAAQRLTAGCMPASQDVPEVRAALAVLVEAGLPVALFAPSGHNPGAGAYLDPRTETGEVVLSYEASWEDRRFNDSYGDRMRRAMVRKYATEDYRRVFSVAGWRVAEVTDPRVGGSVPRLIIKPPEFICEVFVSERAGHCTVPAARVVYAAADLAVGRVLICDEIHGRAFRGPTWTSTTPEAYQAERGPIVPDAAIIGGRKGPQR